MPTQPRPLFWQFVLTAATTVREEKGPVGQSPSPPSGWPASRPGKTTNMNNSSPGACTRLTLSLTHILHVWASGEEDEEEFR